MARNLPPLERKYAEALAKSRRVEVELKVMWVVRPWAALAFEAWT